MRIIGLSVTFFLLAACGTPRIFPPEVMKGVQQSPLDLKAWKEQNDHDSSVDFVPHKVVLAGEVMMVIPKSEGVVLLVAEEPLEKYHRHDFTPVHAKDAFLYAVAFNGFPGLSMLKRGNKLAVVGTTDRASTEIIGEASIVLPRLLAQCLHIWKIDESKATRFPFGDTVGYSPPESTFCDESKRSSLSTDSHNEDKKVLKLREAAVEQLVRSEPTSMRRSLLED